MSDAIPRSSRAAWKAAAIAVALTAGCQNDISTPFPPGLEPLEDNVVPEQSGGPYLEQLRLMSVESPYFKVYARGYVLVAPGELWEAAKNPEANVATCTTSSHSVMANDQPQYEFSFLVHYVVNNILTVEWDDQWRFGKVEGAQAAPLLAVVKHQKIQGSDFINLSEGTIQLSATDDPNVSELAFVEHLHAIGGDVADVAKGVRRNYDALVSVAHNQPIPPCP